MSAASSSSSSSSLPPYTLTTLPFDNLVLRALPVDDDTRTNQRTVSNACFALVSPTPVVAPRVVCVSPSALALLGIDADAALADPLFAAYFSGNKLLPGARPAAHCYCGHQFGHFSGQLGDGATMYLGEVVVPQLDGSKAQRHELQFKGAGKTPFSRTADGRKVLRSSIREFVASEAAHHLGIPTTRAATLVTSDTDVIRDVYYTGNNIVEKASIITRIAPTFLRFGSFEIGKGEDDTTGRSGPSEGRHDIVQKMLDYTIDNFYQSEVATATTPNDRYLLFLRALCDRTAKLVAQWMTVGWCHGVLNTDNMSIVGVTIDYGPYGYMEGYDPEYICNASDNQGRYRYEAQPEICGWNLMKLTENFESFVPKAQMQAIIGEYEGMYRAALNAINRRKLGLGVASTSSSSSASDDDKYSSIVSSFYSTMALTCSDFTNSFRCLSSLRIDDVDSISRTVDTLSNLGSSIASRVASLAPRIPPNQMIQLLALVRTKPEMFVGEEMEGQRDIIMQEAERQAQRAALMKMTQSDKLDADRLLWSKWIDAYVIVLRADVDAAIAIDSSSSASSLYDIRRRMQNSANPKYIFRNWIAQIVIDAAEKGDYSVINAANKRLADPYDVEDEGDAVVQQVSTTCTIVPTSASSSSTSAASTSCSIASSSSSSSHAGQIDWNMTKPEWVSTQECDDIIK